MHSQRADSSRHRRWLVLAMTLTCLLCMAAVYFISRASALHTVRDLIRPSDIIKHVRPAWHTDHRVYWSVSVSPDASDNVYDFIVPIRGPLPLETQFIQAELLFDAKSWPMTQDRYGISR